MALRRSCCWVSFSTLHKIAHKSARIVLIHAGAVKSSRRLFLAASRARINKKIMHKFAIAPRFRLTRRAPASTAAPRSGGYFTAAQCVSRA